MNLAAAAELVLRADCGVLPVVDGGKVVGIVTDRDMYSDEMIDTPQSICAHQPPAPEIAVA